LDDTTTATEAVCCGSTQVTEEAKMPGNITGSCCGTSSQTKEEQARNIIDIDFNEWVGESMTMHSHEDQRFADFKSLGSFSVYAVKP
jgi:hypothetical protein